MVLKNNTSVVACVLCSDERVLFALFFFSLFFLFETKKYQLFYPQNTEISISHSQGQKKVTTFTTQQEKKKKKKKIKQKRPSRGGTLLHRGKKTEREEEEEEEE